MTLQVFLLDDTGKALHYEGRFLLVDGASAQDLAGSSGGMKGGFNNRLWDIFQEEIALRTKDRPKPVPIEPEPEVEEPEPAPPSGFFDAPMDPAEMISRARAAAEAKAMQAAKNRAAVSKMLLSKRR